MIQSGTTQELSNEKIRIRKATQSDVEWISQGLREGAQCGHFSKRMEGDAFRLTVEILDKGGFEILKWREGRLTRNFTKAAILAAEVGGAPAGFLITLLGDQEVELHLAWTLRDFRRKGVFHALVQRQIAESSSTVRIFTRCYQKSTWAMAAFEKEGFAVTKQGNPMELTLSGQPVP
jgi:hypothetical protein